MRQIGITRVLAALICIALLVFAVSAHPDTAIFVLPFSFVVVFAVAPLDSFVSEPAAQPLSFLTLNISRAPPLA